MFKNLFVVMFLFVLSAPVMATNYMGTGQLCQAFTVSGPGKTSACVPITPANQFLSEDSCRKHFEAYLTKNTAAAYATNPNPPATLQASGDKILLKQGTPTNAFTDFTGFVVYSCTLNVNESQ